MAERRLQVSARRAGEAHNARNSPAELRLFEAISCQRFLALSAYGRSPTVILIPGGGRPSQDWEKVQPAVASFARVCSYDSSNIGASDRAPAIIQTPDEAFAALHTLFKASGEKRPFILVGHPSGGCSSGVSS